MNDDRYINHYLKVVNSTLSESVLRNVSLQASANFIDEVFGEMQAEKEALRSELQAMGEKLNKIISERDSTAEQKKKQSEEFAKSKNEVGHIRQQLSHMETFRSQLIESEKTIRAKDAEIEELKKKIESLQSPIVNTSVMKRKKNGVLNTTELNDTIEVVKNTLADTTIKDGGTF